MIQPALAGGFVAMGVQTMINPSKSWAIIAMQPMGVQTSICDGWPAGKNDAGIRAVHKGVL